MTQTLKTLKIPLSSNLARGAAPAVSPVHPDDEVNLSDITCVATRHPLLRALRDCRDAVRDASAALCRAESLADGMVEYKKSQEVEPDPAEGLEDRLLVFWKSKYGVSGYFATEADATLWAQKQVGDQDIAWTVIKATSRECEIADEVISTNDITEVYRAWVPNGPMSLAWCKNPGDCRKDRGAR